MITEKQYLDAVDIIKKYKIQIDELIRSVTRMTVDDFLKLNPGISKRLRNALQHQYYIDNSMEKAVYIDEFDRYRFLRLRQTGKKSWNELQDILNPED